MTFILLISGLVLAILGLSCIFTKEETWGYPTLLLAGICFAFILILPEESESYDYSKAQEKAELYCKDKEADVRYEQEYLTFTCENDFTLHRINVDNLE